MGEAFELAGRLAFAWLAVSVLVLPAMMVVGRVIRAGSGHLEDEG